MGNQGKGEIEKQIRINHPNKTIFYLPQKTKADFLIKLSDENISLQAYLSGLVFLWLEGNEDIANAVRSINKVGRYFHTEKNTGKSVGTIKNQARIRKSLVTPMSTEELAEFFDFTENEIEKNMSEDD
jgi:hypothetical protein